MPNEAEWEPLPKRAKRGTGPSRVAVDPVGELCADVATSEESIHLRHDSEIARNIEARSRASRAVTSLSDQDGCRGEFFECKPFASKMTS
jgi:hypothetical protein